VWVTLHGWLTIRVALHLEAGSIHCVRGLKSSLLWSKVHIGPNPLHLEVVLIWWYDIFNRKKYVMTQPELIELGAPKVEGQYHISLKKHS
jgi:hypothetical protein